MKVECFAKLELVQLDGVEDRIVTKKPMILECIGLYMVAETMQNFDEQGRPKEWTKLADSTLKRKKGTMKLVEFGLLRAGVMFWVDGDAVVVGPSGPSIPYARIQQLGGETGRDGKTKIPSRKYLVVLKENREYIVRFVRSEVLDG